MKRLIATAVLFVTPAFAEADGNPLVFYHPNSGTYRDEGENRVFGVHDPVARTVRRKVREERREEVREEHAIERREERHEEHREERHDVCKDSLKVFGDQALTEGGAVESATKAWNQSIRAKYGEEWADPLNWNNPRGACFKSSVGELKIGDKVIAELHRCVLEAEPCKAAMLPLLPAKR